MAHFSTNHTHKVLGDVEAERKSQVALGLAGKIPHACEDPDTHWGYRLGVLGEEYGEVCTEVIECPPEARPGSDMYKELIQTAAVAVACAESLIEHDLKAWGPETKMHNSPSTLTHRPWSEIPTAPRQANLNEHRAVLERAMKIYEQREDKYKGIWREYGWRGSLMQARSCVERAWSTLWSAPVRPLNSPTNNARQTNDLIDLINYAVFTIRNIETGNRDGTWRYSE